MDTGGGGEESSELHLSFIFVEVPNKLYIVKTYNLAKSSKWFQIFLKNKRFCGKILSLNATGTTGTTKLRCTKMDLKK